MSPAPAIATRIRRAVDEIWAAPPADLRGIAAAHRPPSREMVKRLYANFDLYWTAGFMFFAARQLRNEDAGWAHARRLLAAMAATCAKRLDLWNCTSAASTLREAADGIAGTETTQEGLDIIDAVVLYLNCLGSWVDASIPWSAIDAIPPCDVEAMRP